MQLKDIDTRKFLINPKQKGFESMMLALSPVFHFKIDKVSRKKALTYLTLMYDKNSEIRRDVGEYAQRKYIASLYNYERQFIDIYRLSF